MEKDSGREMKGIAYGVGVGPGDPELMTLKACRLIREGDIIALPGKEAKETVAYKIAVRAVPELAEKELIAIDMPMTKDAELLRESHREGAKQIETYLAQGENVVFLTLGDPCVYCTFTYLQPYLHADGYETRLINGIPSFCAAAAELNMPLVEWDEPMHVLPATHKLERTPGTPRVNGKEAEADCAEKRRASGISGAPGAPGAYGKEIEADCAEKQGASGTSAMPEGAGRMREDFLREPGTCVLMKSGSHMQEVKELLRASGKTSIQMVQDCGMNTQKIYYSVDEIPDDAGYFSLIIAKDGQSPEEGK